MRASLVAVLAVAPVAATVFVLQSDLQRRGADAHARRRCAKPATRPRGSGASWKACAMPWP